MGANATLSKGHTLGGMSFPQSVNLVADACLVQEVSVLAALAGVLTTRNANDDGVVTLNDSVFDLGNFSYVDLYWEVDGVPKFRRGMARTIDGQDISIVGGQGENLPAGLTEVLVCPITPMEFQVATAQLIALVVYCQAMGQVGFWNEGGMDESATHEMLALKLGAQQVWEWNAQDGNPVPLQNGASTFYAYASQVGTSGSKTVRLGCLYDNA